MEHRIDENEFLTEAEFTERLGCTPEHAATVLARQLLQPCNGDAQPPRYLGEHLLAAIRKHVKTAANEKACEQAEQTGFRSGGQPLTDRGTRQ